MTSVSEAMETNDPSRVRGTADPEALARALTEEQSQNARRINLYRFVGISFFFGLFVLLGGVLGMRAWQGNLGYFGPYWIATVLVFVASRRFERVNRVASLAIAFIDMPMVFLLQYATFPTTPNVGAIAGYTLGIYVLLLILEALSLESWKIYVTALVGAICEGALQYLAGISVGAIVSTFIVMGLSAVTCAFAGRRLVRLIENVVIDMETQRRTAEAFAHARDRLEAVTKEMEIASRIQTSILPRSIDVRGYAIAARMIPASEVGGDYYDVRPTTDGCWVGIGDVSGHGLTAGLVMMMIQTAIASLTVDRVAASPDAILRKLNTVLYDNVRNRLLAREHATLTLFHMFDTGHFVMTGAHEEVLVYRAETKRCERIETPGTWIGAVKNIARATVVTSNRLEKGDVMVLYTDGVTEAMNAKGDQYGVDRLCALIEESAASASPDSICDHVTSAVSAFAPKQADDVTVLVMRYEGGHASETTSVEGEDDVSIAIRLTPESAVIPALRRFATEFFTRALRDGDVAERGSMAFHELLENAVRASSAAKPDAPIELRLGTRTRGRDMRIVIEAKNYAARAEGEKARALVEELSSAPDARDHYMKLMRESMKRKHESGLGLGRIRAEAGMNLSCLVEGDEISVRAVGRYVRGEE